MSRRSSCGFTLIELVIAMAIVGLVAAATIPAFASMQRRSALRAAAGELRAIFHLARSRAIARNANCGVRFFQTGGEWMFAIHDDADGDGVRNDDIKKGIDRQVGQARVALPESDMVTIGLPGDSIVDPAGKALSPSSSPVRFNASSICSFSPLGESTPGTIYLRDRGGDVFAVRVYGGSAKIRVLRYVRASQEWVP